MKKAILFLLALISTGRAEAKEINPNINQGNIEIGGSFNLSKIAQPNFPTSSTSWSVMGNGQYFFLDHVSVGLDAGWAGVKYGGSSVWLGPAATWYFLVHENIAPFVMFAPWQWSKLSGRTGISSSTVRLGTKFFLTDSVAFGPALQYQHVYSSGITTNTYSFIGVFSIHL